MSRYGIFYPEVEDDQGGRWRPDDSEGMAQDSFEEAEAVARRLVKQVASGGDRPPVRVVLHNVRNNNTLRLAWRAEVHGDKLGPWSGPKVEWKKAGVLAHAVLAAGILLVGAGLYWIIW